MFCSNCGSQIDDNAVVCPNCGVATANYYKQSPASSPEKENILAIVGFILSLFVAVAGLVCSVIGYKSAPQYGGKGKNFALAGIIISAAEIVLSLIAVIILIVIAFIFGSAATYSIYI